jgi:hypothetical protein
MSGCWIFWRYNQLPVFILARVSVARLSPASQHLPPVLITCNFNNKVLLTLETKHTQRLRLGCSWSFRKRALHSGLRSSRVFLLWRRAGKFGVERGCSSGGCTLATCGSLNCSLAILIAMLNVSREGAHRARSPWSFVYIFPCRLKNDADEPSPHHPANFHSDDEHCSTRYQQARSVPCNPPWSRPIRTVDQYTIYKTKE